MNSDSSQKYKLFLMCLALGLGIWWGWNVLSLLRIIANN